MAARLTTLDRKKPDPGGQLTPLTEEQKRKLLESMRKKVQKAAGKRSTPTTTTMPKAGTGGPNDPSWGQVAKLLKDGLPG